MGLKKDEICVWLCQIREKTGTILSLLACPKNRRRESESRLAAAASKKIKGNRLPSLDYSQLDAASLPFCEEFIRSLFRISDLSGFASLFYSKTSQLEALVYASAGRFLKEQYPGCSFVIYSDPGQIRSSALQNWKKKAQLQAVFEPDEASHSVFLQTASLVGQLLYSQTSPAFLEMQSRQDLLEKVSRLIQMDRTWAMAAPLDLYAPLMEEKERKDFEAAAKKIPGLLEAGILEKWLRKGLPEGYFSLVHDLLRQGMDPSVIAGSQPVRLVSQAQEMLAVQKKAETPFPEEAFERWVENGWKDLQAFSGYSQMARQGIFAQKKSFAAALRQQIDAWIDQPKSIQNRLFPSFYLTEGEQSIRAVKTALMPWMEKTSSQREGWPSLKAAVLPVSALSDFLFRFSRQRKLASLYVPDTLIEQCRRWCIETGEFIPLYPLQDGALQIVETAREDLSLTLSRFLPDPSGSHPFFCKEVSQKLTEEQRKFLMMIPLDSMQARLLARAFGRGLSLEHAAAWMIRPKKSVYRLVRPYLYSTRMQNLLDTVHTEAELSLLSRPGLKISGMEALKTLCHKGIPADWLMVNLKGRATEQRILRLGEQYPWGRIPWSWQICEPMPEELEDWVFHQGAAAHPQMDSEALRQSLAGFCTLLFSLVFQKH